MEDKSKGVRRDQEKKDTSESRDKWQMEFTEGVIVELLGLIEQQEKVYGAEFGNRLRMSVLASFISALIYGVLTSSTQGKGDLKQDTDELHLQFTDAKEAIAMAVVSGIEGAVKSWSGQNLQYHCDIQLEPEALNTEPC